MNTKQIKFNRYKYISAAAACLAVVIIITYVIGGFNGNGNSFVLKASAVEISGNSFTEFAKVSPIYSESGNYDEVEIKSNMIPFSIKCDGKNIKSIKYSVENAVFLFPYNSYATEFREQYPKQASASDKITDKIESNNKIECNIEKDKQYSSYTVSFDDQFYTEFNNDFNEMDKFPIQLFASISSDDNISEEAKAAFEHSNSEGSLKDEKFVDELFKDFGVIINEMLSKVKVTAEITYNDGSTDSTSLQFNCLSADQQNGIVIGAKTV